MAHDHNFSVGRPDNLGNIPRLPSVSLCWRRVGISDILVIPVYVDELLDVLEDKLKKMLCLYCEKTFKDWQTLKEHMRKKQHKKINPRNTAYDKYYVVNYAVSDIPYAEGARIFSSFISSEWKDWADESEETQLICLMCSEAHADILTITKHMNDVHKFDFTRVREGLGFYQQIKVVNFLRKQVSTGEMFYFPTYENDQLLCALEDEALPEGSTDEVVVPEELAPPDKRVLEALESRE
ncbi:hypothetical protein HPB48_010780 [Haemaphysalis longicornis]|uniref:C2H2-type domain-containing protein n=1 Tax=Haemaphysalis longicornis TaxID=44386 RepID=A0A9J6H315_HAELO|nr:hypothetical protein HPB48_010780 [Haemaphysalis longicornis]